MTTTVASARRGLRTIALFCALGLIAARGASSRVSDGACQYYYESLPENSPSCAGYTKADACEDAVVEGFRCSWDTPHCNFADNDNAAKKAALAEDNTDPGTVALWKIHNTCKNSGKTRDDCEALEWCVDGEDLLVITPACAVDDVKFFEARCKSSATYYPDDKNVTASASFDGISGSVTIDSTLVNSLTTALLKSTIGETADAPTPTVSYVVTGKQTYGARVDETDFKTQVATTLSVDASTISNVKQSMASSKRRRLLAVNDVTYDMTTDQMSKANNARASTSGVSCKDESGASTTGTAGTAVTAVKITLELQVDATLASDIEAKIDDNAFKSTLTNAAAAQGVNVTGVSGNAAAPSLPAASAANRRAFTASTLAVITVAAAVALL